MIRFILLAALSLATISTPVRSGAQRTKRAFDRAARADDGDGGIRPPAPRTAPATKSGVGDGDAALPATAPATNTAKAKAPVVPPPASPAKTKTTSPAPGPAKPKSDNAGTPVANTTRPKGKSKNNAPAANATSPKSDNAGAPVASTTKPKAKNNTSAPAANTTSPKSNNAATPIATPAKPKSNSSTGTPTAGTNKPKDNATNAPIANPAKPKRPNASTPANTPLASAAPVAGSSNGNRTTAAPNGGKPAAKPAEPVARNIRSKTDNDDNKAGSGRASTKPPSVSDDGDSKKPAVDKDSRNLSKRKPADGAPNQPATTDDKPRKTTGYRRPVPRYKYPNTTKRDRYRIDVLASFYLNELVKSGQPAFSGKVPDKAQGALSFYEGMMLAADTLDAEGYDLDIHVHDITDSATSVDALIRTGAFAQSDLLIGAVQSAQIPKLAAYAKSHNINFVSALSPADGGVKDNPYFTLLQPSLQSHCDRIRTYVSKQKGRGQVVLLHHTGNNTDDFAYRQLSRLDGNKFRTLDMAGLPDHQQFAALLDSTEENVLIIPALDGGYTLSMLRHLATDYSQYRFRIYGMPSWRNLSFIRNADSTPNMAISITEPFYYDPTTPAAQTMIAEYALRYNGGRPGDMVYRGYETMLWYAYLLKKYGTIFNSHLSDNAVAPFTRFEVDDKKDDDGALMYLENHQLNMVHYDKGMYRVEY